ncbi:aldehyde dehydrogenase family protein [Acinetobacter sp. ANC 4635]|uniref:aldehyde dehydrogenase family protein n=1 Tax=Acinetobacter sp. ANC 4635 TaxID=2529846 RepID=UPI00103EE380|nr:aldehyde dehydrogenase family protein [Acinetobacter sp. ANC 4635]TCB26280.1 aldehyde dehydrogenase family protein [Acinetobacter sp. ANC 4635]
MSLVQITGFINGEFLPASDQTQPVYDPGNTSQQIGTISNTSLDDVKNAIESAHQAFLAWRNTTVAERQNYLKQAADLIFQQKDILKELLVSEHGGMLWEAETDFYLGSGVMSMYAQAPDDLLTPKEIAEDTGWIRIHKRPKGVISAIVPWNMPIVLTMMKLGPLLLAGNTVVLKPSPFAALALTQLLAKIAEIFPKGVINVVHGDADVGNLMTSHPLVRKVAFTGGTATGAAVMASAAQSIKDVTLELGGNDAAIILDDIDFKSILPKLLKGIFTRSGQICFAVKRVYVPKDKLDHYFELLCEAIDQYKVGHGLDADANFGPLNNKKQLSIVQKFIENAKASDQCEVRELGQKLNPEQWENGYYVLPHAVKTLDNSLEIVQLEQFGPIIPLIGYETVEQAIEYANDNEQGLCSSVWSDNIDRAYEIAQKIEAGSTFINTHSFDSLQLGMPFGGVKQSGIGRELDVNETLKSYLEPHSIRFVK